MSSDDPEASIIEVELVPILLDLGRVNQEVETVNVPANPPADEDDDCIHLELHFPLPPLFVVERIAALFNDK